MKLATKYCSRCKEVKSISLFYNSSIRKDKISVYCKKCSDVSTNKWRADNPGKDIAMKKNMHLKKKYGITLDQYNQMLICQNSVCAICLQREISVDYRKSKLRDLCVDHDHETGKIRGLLCWDCNSSLGKFKDSIDIVSNALEYLKRFR